MKLLIVIVLSLLGFAGATEEDQLKFKLAKFMVKLEIAKPNGCMVCSGSFILKNWILTAGHCIEDANNLVAYVGFNSDVGYVVNKTDFFTRTYVQWSERRHDIALIRFPYNEFWDDISPVRLGSALYLPSAHNGEEPVFVGFHSGCTGNYSGLHAILYLPILTKQSCTLGTRLLFFNAPLREEHLCAHTRYTCLCKNDPSGHLFLKESNELVAILTQPKDKSCSELIFSRVSYYTKFIEIVTGIDLPGGGWNRSNRMAQDNSTLHENTKSQSN